MPGSLTGNYSLLESRLNKIVKRVRRKSDTHKRIKLELESIQRKAQNSRKEYKASIKAQLFLQNLAQSVQRKAHKQISDIVSQCLETVFDEPYEFRINFVKKRGRTEAELQFIREGEVYHPMKSTGGGVVDIASFALRLAAIVLTRPSSRRVLILDEPFRFVSPDYRDRVKVLLESLATEMGLQFIIVTHAKALRVGKVISL